MKSAYTKPIMNLEMFQANEYVAACYGDLTCVAPGYYVNGSLHNNCDGTIENYKDNNDHPHVYTGNEIGAQYSGNEQNFLTFLAALGTWALFGYDAAVAYWESKGVHVTDTVNGVPIDNHLIASANNQVASKNNASY